MEIKKDYLWLGHYTKSVLGMHKEKKIDSKEAIRLLKEELEIVIRQKENESK